jgi:diacylglycerol kinase family enzyme
VSEPYRLGDRRLLVVANSSAGSATSERLEAALEVLRVGAEVRLATTGSVDELAEVISGRDGQEIVTVGGDGSLHALAAALIEAGELDSVGPIGLLPCGTGNDLARTLGLPLNPASAAKIVLGGRPRPLDMLVDDAGGVVVNAVHAGIGAEAGRVAKDWKPRIGPSAYAAGGVVAGFGAAGWWVRVEVDGEPVHDATEPVLMVGIGNGRTIGGGSPLTPSAVPDDGLVDVVVSRATGALERLTYAVDMRAGDHVHRDDVEVARGRTVTVRGKPFRCNADGEISEEITARSWQLRPAAWSIRVPVVNLERQPR